MRRLLASLFYFLGDIALYFDWGAFYQWTMRTGDSIEFPRRYGTF